MSKVIDKVREIIKGQLHAKNIDLSIAKENSLVRGISIGVINYVMSEIKERVEGLDRYDINCHYQEEIITCDGEWVKTEDILGLFKGEDNE